MSSHAGMKRLFDPVATSTAVVGWLAAIWHVMAWPWFDLDFPPWVFWVAAGPVVVTSCVLGLMWFAWMLQWVDSTGPEIDRIANGLPPRHRRRAGTALRWGFTLAFAPWLVALFGWFFSGGPGR